jgi:SAM-dependent methyltransferase
MVARVSPGQRVLEVGCGEGALTCAAAQAGADAVAVDMSAPNLEAARRLAAAAGVRVALLQADAERLPFADGSFDLVLSSHVLEHLPDLDRGLRELQRVTRDRVLIAMPTCLNPACWALLGGDGYWTLSRRSPIAVPLGFARTVWARLRGHDGPDEGYGPGGRMPHVWRFPSVMRRRIERAGLRIEAFEAGPLILPYLAEYLTPWRRLQPALDRLAGHRLLRNFGYGSMAVCRKAAGP